MIAKLGYDTSSSQILINLIRLFILLIDFNVVSKLQIQLLEDVFTANIHFNYLINDLNNIICQA